MTLEEKIKNVIERAYRKGVLDGKETNGNAKAAGAFLIVSQVTAFEIFKSDPALSELKPVMDEMESCMKSTLATIDSPDTFINQILLEKDSYFKPDALVKELKSTLSKYNELFKK